MVSILPEDYKPETLEAILSLFSQQVNLENWEEYKGELYGPLDILSLYCSAEKKIEQPFLRVLFQKVQERINTLEAISNKEAVKNDNIVHQTLTEEFSRLMGVPNSKDLSKSLFKKEELIEVIEKQDMERKIRHINELNRLLEGDMDLLKSMVSSRDTVIKELREENEKLRSALKNKQ